MSVDWVIVEHTGVNWPGLLPYRGLYSRTGYPTEVEANARARFIRSRYTAEHGSSGPDLRVNKRTHE